MHLIKSLGTATGPIETGRDVSWTPGQLRLVSDEVLLHYENNPAAWTVLAGPGMEECLLAMIVEANAVGAGTVVEVDGLSVTDTGVGEVRKTVFTFDSMELTVTDALAYASQQIYDFPAGRILILGATGSLEWAVETARTTINDDASLTWSVGNAAASNITLAGTMINILPKATKVLAADTNEFNTPSTNALVASAQLDGTGTALDAFLNVGFETNTQIDGDGLLLVSGSITVTWVNLGDY
jgi:hypothetical protein